jgi:DNA polymerase III epsilon subunit-like protein
MQFHKDILLIDFEGVKDPVQVGCLLLDKVSLAEKSSFSSYIYADLAGYINPKTGISQDMINDAPKLDQVGSMIYERFGADVFVASFVQNMDVNHFQTLLAAAGIDFLEGKTDFKKYDFHILDLWPIAYVHLLKSGYQGGFGSEEMFQAFGAKPRGLHDALEDCRLAADVLRKIVFS